MAFAIPTGSFISYTEAACEYERLAGNAPGDISTKVGQSVAAGVHQAHHEIVRCLRARGYSMAQIASWGLAEGKSLALYLSVYYWGRDGVLRTDDTWWTIVQTYRERWEECCRGGSLFDENGDLLDPDTGGAEADALQGESTFRNGPPGPNHNFVFDAHPMQFMGDDNAPNIAAGARYGNGRFGEA